jgi:hypothetical protein
VFGVDSAFLARRIAARFDELRTEPSAARALRAISALDVTANVFASRITESDVTVMVEIRWARRDNVRGTLVALAPAAASPIAPFTTLTRIPEEVQRQVDAQVERRFTLLRAATG